MPRVRSFNRFFPPSLTTVVKRSLSELDSAMDGMTSKCIPGNLIAETSCIKVGGIVCHSRGSIYCHINRAHKGRVKEGVEGH